jgi:glycosyltransferase involved in cell wall biosynthesis
MHAASGWPVRGNRLPARKLNPPANSQDHVNEVQSDTTVGSEPVLVSILVKALNEAGNIERCLSSCLVALQGIRGEVIVADSLSEDDTVAIASRFPVRVVQLLRAEDRGCGVAAQMAYQYARGKYIHIIDGDMELPGQFLREAILILETRRDVAGVGGQLEELRPGSHLSRIRSSRARAAHEKSGEVDRLNGGGLYRRQAIEQAGGYLTHAGLHAHEELELGLRLRAAGWKLLKTESVSMRHAAHTDPPFKLLARRWRSRYALGPGELVRSSIGQPYLPRVLREARFHFAMWAYWSLLLAGLLASIFQPLVLVLVLAAVLLPVAAMSLRKRSVTLGTYAVASWHVFAAGTARGLCSRNWRSPHGRIPSILVHDGSHPPASRAVMFADAR